MSETYRQQLPYLNIIAPDESAYRHAGARQVGGRNKRSRLLVENHNIAGNDGQCRKNKLLNMCLPMRSTASRRPGSSVASNANGGCIGDDGIFHGHERG